MIDNFKEYMQVPFEVITYAGMTGTGTKRYNDPVSYLCYPAVEDKKITNNAGEEIVSNTQLYCHSNVIISLNDKITFEGYQRPIKAIRSYYGPNGIVEYKVVYI